MTTAEECCRTGDTEVVSLFFLSFGLNHFTAVWWTCDSLPSFLCFPRAHLEVCWQLGSFSHPGFLSPFPVPSSSPSLKDFLSCSTILNSLSEGFWPFATGPPTSAELCQILKAPLSKHACLITAASAPSQTSRTSWQREPKPPVHLPEQRIKEKIRYYVSF